MPRLDDAQIAQIISAREVERPVFDYAQPNRLFADNGGDLDYQIKQMEKALAQCRGPLIEIDGYKVRVFNGEKDFNIQKENYYARAMQFAHAAVKVSEFEETELNREFLRRCLLHYTQRIQQITGSDAQAFEQIKGETDAFMSILSEHLAQQRFAKQGESALTEKQVAIGAQKAFDDLKKATELYNMLEPNETSIATVQVAASGVGYEVQVSHKIGFSQPFDEDVRKAKDSIWFKQGKEKYGTWYERFMDANLADVLQKSPPCTTRDMPNPANAWEDHSYSIGSDGEIAHHEQKVRLAITTPFDIKDASARVEMAADSMKALLSKERLEQMAQEYLDRWGPLLETGESIDISLLHQTLVAPTFFYAGDRNMLDVKERANAEVAKYLAELDIRVGGPPPRKVNFNLGQVNHCVNMWHPVIVPRNHDINDSNHLVVETAKMMQRLERKTRDAGNSTTADQIAIVNQYLNDNRRSWLPFGPFSRRSPTPKQKEAMKALNKQLVNGSLDIPGLDMSRQKDLSLMLQAAVNLKKLNHETHFGYGIRRLNNSVRIKGVAVLAPVVGIITAPVHITAYIGKVARRLYTRARDGAPPRLIDAFVPTRNNLTAISAYEGILGDKFGLTLGGCKSAFDREGEVGVHRNAMIRAFNESGELFEATVSDKEYYDFMSKHIQEVEKGGHANNICAHIDSIGARKMWETRTHQWETTSPQEKKKIKLAAKLRKPSKVLSGEQRGKMLQEYDAATLKRAHTLTSLSEATEDSQGEKISSSSLRGQARSIPSTQARVTIGANRASLGVVTNQEVDVIFEAGSRVSNSPSVTPSATMAPASGADTPSLSSTHGQRRAEPISFQQRNHIDRAQESSVDVDSVISESIKFTDLKRYVQSDEAKEKHGILSTREMQLNGKPSIEMTFEHEENRFKGYGTQASDDNVSFAVESGLTQENKKEALRRICEVAVAMANPYDEFNLEATSGEDNALITELITQCLAKAKEQGKFTEENCPTISGLDRPLFTR